MFEVMGIAPPLPVYRYGLNLRQVVSRMLIQMIAKAYAAELWGKRSIWVMQDILYEYLVRTTKLSLLNVRFDDITESQHSLLFFIYELVMSDAEHIFNLRLKTIKGGDRKQVEAVLQPHQIPSLSEMKVILKQHIQARRYIELL